MGVDGSEPKQLTFIPDGACQPEWSPDGASLLFISPCSGKDTDYPRAAIYHMQADGSNVRFFISLGVGSVFDADWSEAGIVFTYLESNQPRLWKATASGTDTQQISQARADDEHASWGPEGDKLVFVNTSRIGVPTLMWMFADGTFNGSSPDQVSRDQTASTPAWSPLGDLVAYIVSQQVWVVKWDAKGFNAVQLTNRGPNADPDWSPDGLWLTFESWRDAANHDIYIMTSNGGLQTRLTEDPAADYQPAWRP
jgi:Tol biopolymer transport system component